jgi:putative chitinase
VLPRPWLLATPALLLTIGLLSFGCGGSGPSSRPLDLSQVPTATLPNPLPAPVVLEGPGPAGPGDETTYTVVDGDNLSAIADRFGTTVEAIAAANGIEDPTQLSIGQVLTIPGAAAPGESEVLPESVEPTEEAEPEATPAPPAEGEIYIVQDGDIPETIAAQFGITADELMAANGITDPTSLQIGQELIIPAPSE